MNAETILSIVILLGMLAAANGISLAMGLMAFWKMKKAVEEDKEEENVGVWDRYSD